MPAGRPPKPYALKKLEGNRHKGVLEPPKPVTEKGTDPPRCPKFLDSVAREEWKRLAFTLWEVGLLREHHVGTFAAYCSAVSSFQHSNRMLLEHAEAKPDAYMERIKLKAALAQDRLQVMRFGAEFGLTPVGQEKVPQLRGGADKHDPDETLNGNWKPKAQTQPQVQ